MEARVDAMVAEIDKLDEVGASGQHKILALAHDAGNHKVVVDSQQEKQLLREHVLEDHQLVHETLHLLDGRGKPFSVAVEVSQASKRE